MDFFDAAATLRCPHDGVVMRDDPRGYRCPACGLLIDDAAERAVVVMPPDFDGPSIHGG